MWFVGFATSTMITEGMVGPLPLSTPALSHQS
jgi:hypothetical protein